MWILSQSRKTNRKKNPKLKILQPIFIFFFILRELYHKGRWNYQVFRLFVWGGALTLGTSSTVSP